LKQKGRWELAPAYDITHAYNPKGEWTYQHLMSVNSKFNNITRTDMLAEADRFSVPGAKNILLEVHDAIENWPKAAREAGLGKTVIDRVAKDFWMV
jgi:serine/threonine-protein kinase HipA